MVQTRKGKGGKLNWQVVSTKQWRERQTERERVSEKVSEIEESG